MEGSIWEIVFRSIAAFAVLFTVVRLMGKKQVAHLTFFDYIVGITVGSIAAAVSIDPRIKLWNGVISICIWAAFSILFAIVNLKSMRARRLLEGAPTILIRNGKLIEENLRKQKYNLNDLLEGLRAKDAFNIADVEFAVLETDGTVSVLKKSQKMPVTPKDLNIPTKYEGLCANLIIDGEIMHENLHMVGLDEVWLRSELSKMKIESPERVFLASLDTQGKLYINQESHGSGSKTILE